MTQSKHARPRHSDAERNATHSPVLPLRNWVILPVLVVAVAVLIVLMSTQSPAPVRTDQPEPISAADLPAPWTYDRATDQHWHPGHQHWHAGEPPQSERPEPWFYDETRDEHWHAEHLHWHPGPPPPPEERQDAAAAPIEQDAEPADAADAAPAEENG